MLTTREFTDAELADLLEDFRKRYDADWLQYTDHGLIAECVKRLRAAALTREQEAQPIGYVHDKGNFHAVMPAWKPEAAQPMPANAQHWHDLYRAECLKRQDDAARYGGVIEALEAAQPAAQEPTGVSFTTEELLAYWNKAYAAGKASVAQPAAQEPTK